MEDRVDYVPLLQDPHYTPRSVLKQFTCTYDIVCALRLISGTLSPDEAALIVATLKFHQDQADLVLEAFQAIHIACRDTLNASEPALELLNRKVLFWILNALETCSSLQKKLDRKFVVGCACAVHSLALHLDRDMDSFQFDSLMQEKFISVFFEAICSFGRFDRCIALHCTWAILNLCYQRSNQEFVGRLGFIEKVVELMKCFPEDEELQDKYCGALRNLADSSQNRQVIAKHNGVSLLFQAMDSFPRSVSLNINALGAIRTLSLDQKCRESIVYCGGAKQILIAMETFPYNCLVRELAFESLANLCQERDFLSRLSNESLSLLKCITEAMSFFKSEPGLQCEACNLVGALCLFSELLELFSQSSIATLVILASKRFPEVQKLQETACHALLVLSSSSRNLDQLAKLGVFGRIFRAMKSFPDNQKIQEYGCGVILNLCSRAKYRIRIVEKGGISRILRAMESFSHSAVIVERSLETLSLLCTNDQTHRDVLTTGKGLKAVVNAMKEHSDSPAVHQFGADIVSNLVLSEYNQIKFVNLDGIQVLADSMKKFMDDASVMERTCAALWNLSVHTLNQEMIAERGILGLVVEAMQKHIQIPSFQQIVCGALRNLSLNSNSLFLRFSDNYYSENNQIRFRCLEVIPVLLQSMDLYIDLPILQQEACGALVHLALNGISFLMSSK